MTLPVSPTQPMVGYMLYDMNSPPFIPNVTILPSVAHLLPMVSAYVANEATNKAQSNAARMFCYNMLVDNYWNNSRFAEVVKLVCDMVSLNLHKGNIRTPESNTQDSATQALQLYTSDIIFLYPDLKSMVSPAILNAAYGNVSTFNNLKQEIIGMYNNNPVNHGMFAGNVMGANAHAPMQHPNMYPHGGPMMMPVMPGQYPGHQPHGGFPSHPPQHPMQSGFGNPGGGVHGGATLSRISSDTASEGANIRQDRFFTRPQPVPAAREELPVQAKALVAAEKEVQTHLLIDKGSEVERSKLQVPLLGESYSTDMFARSRRYIESVNALSEEGVSEDPQTTSHIHPKFVIELCLDTAIIAGRVQQFEYQENESINNVFRCFALICTPIVSTEEIAEFAKNLTDSTSFTQLVVKIKSMATSLSIKSENKRYSDNVVVFLNQFDNLMTDLVNDFLLNKLGLKLKIMSFTDDVTELPNYLHRNFGVNYAQAFSTFENDIINSVLQSIPCDTEQQIKADFNIPQGMGTAIFPVSYSLTYTFMLDKELGYMLDKEAVVIDPRTAPTLYKIAESLEMQKKELEMSTVHDILITSDNVKYRLYKNYMTDGEYKIARY